MPLEYFWHLKPGGQLPEDGLVHPGNLAGAGHESQQVFRFLPEGSPSRQGQQGEVRHPAVLLGGFLLLGVQQGSHL